MKISYTRTFIKKINKLPKIIRDKAEKQEEIFKNDFSDRRLKTHKLSGKLKGLYSFSVDGSYRIIFEIVGNEDKSKKIYFHTIGKHDEVYD